MPVAKVTKFDLYLLGLKTGDLVEWSKETGLSRAYFYKGVREAAKGPNPRVFKHAGHYYKS